VSSRKEQKERLRRERLERERAAKEAARRKRMVGYGVGGLLGLAAVVVVALLLLGGGGSDKASAEVLPEGGSVPEQRVSDLSKAAKAAGCELKQRRVKKSELNPQSGNFHFPDINKKPSDPFNPPSSGAHYQEPAGDAAYSKAPPAMQIVHAEEHGRVVVWFKRDLSEDARANLKAFFDEDTYQMLLTPNTTGMPYQVAATAWNRDPTPLGTGRLLGCPRYGDKVFDALRAFREANRSNGPEVVP
jgi:Protein of unknown function (DUF3105)